MKNIIIILLLVFPSLAFSTEMVVQTTDGKRPRFDTSEILKIYFQEKAFSVTEYVIDTEFVWIDENVGKELGTITFSSDGNAYPSWSRVRNTWKIDDNKNLVVYTDGYLYVTRFKLNKTKKFFNGSRDRKNNRKDGVISILKPIR